MSNNQFELASQVLESYKGESLAKTIKSFEDALLNSSKTKVVEKCQEKNLNRNLFKAATLIKN